MTKYEACCKLKEWGMKQPGPGHRCVGPSDDCQYEELVYVPYVDDLLSFAESIAEEKWPEAERSRTLAHVADGRYIAEIGNCKDWSLLVCAESDIDYWWALYYMIEKMKEA